MNLIEQYQDAVKQKKIQDDPLQGQVVTRFQQLWDVLHKPRPTWLFWKKPAPIQGIYLYGPVGVGKTYIMDLFYHAMTPKLCARYHFHQFMQTMDAELRQLQGKRDPVQWIAKRLASQIRVLCLDEMMVQDIMQATLFVNLLEALSQQGVVLVATANSPPEQLYLNGINRERFLPAIDWMLTHCDILALPGEKDYRFGHLLSKAFYFTPLGEQANKAMLAQFNDFETGVETAGEICIERRMIPFVRRGKKAIWFDFQVLCQIPRCQLDYLALSEQFEMFYLSNVPALTADGTVAVLLLMVLVDVLYDKRRHLVISAATPLDGLYVAGPMFGEFARTRSRLEEMQSKDYA